MREATEGSLPPVMPQGNLVEVLGPEVRQRSPGELKVESSPSRQRRPPCKTNKEMSDAAADAAALIYLLTWLLFTCVPARCVVLRVRCPGPPNVCSPVCPLCVLCCACSVLASWLLLTGMPAF